ncbi:glycosyltransferase family 4 protein [Microbacterium sp. KSW4-11]|uniref:D-inositol 3-phosphate glycosyltransferase n=1 Tax=Microbacterium gawkjiense TaxID=3067309 RepID=A0ABU3GAB1_9MICO|nr:glycosyltransferase family 4 protein [Microbacterium sp. KSW4-11]MDT3316721.1 glycosyltransferase family 4 protein [Microbacterium sp. KSW4-11]
MTAGRASEHWLVILNEYADLSTYTGGVGRRYAALVPQIARHDISVTVLLFAESEIQAPPQVEGVEFKIEKVSRRIPRPLRLVIRPLLARKLYSRLQPAVVVSPEWQGISAFLPRSANLVTNVVTGMRLINSLTPGRSRRIGIRRVADLIQIRLEEMQIARSRGAISVSSAIDKMLKARFGDALKSRVVRNCIDVAAVKDLAMRKNIPSSWPAAEGSPGPLFLFAGRLEARKGAPVAAAAFDIVARSVSDARFVFAGGLGDTTKELGEEGLRALMASTDQRRVHFLGDLRGDFLYGAMASATTVLCPSRWEAFGNIALEAKASGRPVIVTAGSGFDDFCTDGVDAYKCLPDDAASLAAACLRSIGDPAKSDAIASNAFTQVDYFAAPIVARDFIAAVEELTRS